MRISAIGIAAALALSTSSFISAAHAAGSTQPFAGAATTGSCTIKKTEVAAADSFDQSSSLTFVNLGDAGAITFKSKKAGCVGGTFFANAGNASTGDSVVLQILIDGSPCEPLIGTYFFANSGSDFSSHSAAFFCGANIAAGTHRIQVQYSSFDGGEVQFYQRTLEVTHS
ncbi:MAG TPA: hypothetical protein VHU23_12955 [Rhizomicrobium sp.]|jgi:hypothetical protein|nr:hypothetical protein [Rhizomicrobium sp.]